MIVSQVMIFFILIVLGAFIGATRSYCCALCALLSARHKVQSYWS